MLGRVYIQQVTNEANFKINFDNESCFKVSCKFRENISLFMQNTVKTVLFEQLPHIVDNLEIHNWVTYTSSSPCERSK